MDREGKPPSQALHPERDSDTEQLGGFGVNAALVEEIRQRYEVDPSSVHASWAEHFEKDAGRREPAPAASPAQPAPVARGETPPERTEIASQLADRHARVLRLIHSYRARGHRIADTDPLEGRPSYFPELDPAHYGFGDDDLDRSYIAEICRAARCRRCARFSIASSAPTAGR